MSEPNLRQERRVECLVSTANTKRPRLRWKMRPKETGLRAVSAGRHRSSEYSDGVNDYYASVSPLGGYRASPLRGWYWVAGSEPTVPYKNTCNEPVPDEATAKKEAEAWVKKHLSANVEAQPTPKAVGWSDGLDACVECGKKLRRRAAEATSQKRTATRRARLGKDRRKEAHTRQAEDSEPKNRTCAGRQRTDRTMQRWRNTLCAAQRLSSTRRLAWNG